MHSKLPALVLWCVAFSLLALCQVEADDKKRPAESKKAAPAKKSEPGRKSVPKRSEPGKSESKSNPLQGQVTKLNEQVIAHRKEVEKLRNSLHTAQKELAAKAQAIKALETKNAQAVDALKKGNEEIKKAVLAETTALARLKDAEDELKDVRGELAKGKDELKKSAEAKKRTDEELARSVAAGKKANDDLKKANEANQKAASELKKKAGELAKADVELKKLRALDPERLTRTLEAERKKAAALQTELKETQEKARKDLAEANTRFAAARKQPAARKPEPKKPAAKKPEPKKPAKPNLPTVAPIQYDLNSAVNMEERDRVLNELRGVLKRSPKATIQITGYADDTPYREANNEIGSNRANFLGKYLILKGVPEDRISCRGVGSAKQGRGNGNRKAVIQIKS